MVRIRGTRHKPECIVSFSTEKGELIARSKPTKQGESIDGDVLTVLTQNDLAQDTGTFQLTLSNRNSWDKKLASNDLVSIIMRRKGESKEKATVFIGLIDDVRKNTNIQETTVQRVITVTGRSFFKAILNFEVGVVPEVAEIVHHDLGWVSGRVTFQGNSSAEIIKDIMEILVFEYMNYKFENGKSLQDMLKLDLSSREGEMLVDATSFTNYQGNIYSFIKELADEPFNQLYSEVYDGVPTMVERATPFNPDDWENLKEYKITDVDVLNESIGRSDLETFTLFSVASKNYFGGFDIARSTGVRPLWYKPFFEKHGIKRLNRFTGYVGHINQDDIEKLKQYQIDLFNWNIMNPNYYNGTISVIGDSKYKIGERLIYESEEQGETYEFFIEGVSHNFINFGNWITTLQVTRGLTKAGEDRFKYPWGAYSEYEAGALGATVVDPSSLVPTGTGSGNSNLVFPPNLNIGGTRGQVVQIAQSWLNRPNKYVWGGGRNQSDINNGRFDCSSFVHHVFKQAGIDLGNVTGVTTDTLAKRGVKIYSTSQLLPGDLIFFNTYKRNGHVVIYIGDGKAIGSQSSTGVATLDVKTWENKYGIGTMTRIIQ